MHTHLFLLLLGACGAPPEPPAPAAPPPPVEEPALDCPQGTRFVEQPSAEGLERWCEKSTIRHGPYERLHPDGTSAVRGSYEHGERNGNWSWFSENGEKSRGRYRQGKPVGNWTWWHANGRTREEGDYLDGRQAGVWTRYYESGRKMEEGLYQNGQKSGPWTTYADDEENSVVKVEQYVAGQLVEEGTAKR